MGLPKELDPAKLPRHVAIIMDGNGRWAKKRNLPRLMGHRAGAESVRVITRAAGEWGVEVLTLYAFSVENWSRPRTEVEGLWKLLRQYLRSELQELNANNVRLQAIGRTHELPREVREELFFTIDQTSKNTGLILNLALNYGGRAEIVDAVNRLMREGVREVTEETLAQALYNPALPDPDLIIRTSGEYRMSNFLLWEAAYTEWYVTETLWPDFRRSDFLKALIAFQRRERRFGGLG